MTRHGGLLSDDVDSWGFDWIDRVNQALDRPKSLKFGPMLTDSPMPGVSDSG